MSTTTHMALIRGLAPSFNGQSSSLEGAVERAFSESKYAQSVIGKLKPDAQIKVAVYDYVPYDRITWDDGGVTGIRPDGTHVQIAPQTIVTLDSKGKITKTEAVAPVADAT